MDRHPSWDCHLLRLALIPIPLGRLTVAPKRVLIIRRRALRVATVDPDFQVVQMGRDYGTTVNVVQRLSEKDRLLAVVPVVTPTTGSGASTAKSALNASHSAELV